MLLHRARRLSISSLRKFGGIGRLLLVAFVLFICARLSGSGKSGSVELASYKPLDVIHPAVVEIISFKRPIKKHNFPKRIWQTWKEPIFNSLTASWLHANPSWRYELLTDASAGEWLATRRKGKLPANFFEVFSSLSLPVVKADLLRYILLLLEGGLYTDIDTLALAPIDSWMSDAKSTESIRLAIGIDTDEPDATQQDIKKWGWSKSFTFCQWTILATPHHPAIRAAAERAVGNIIRLAGEKEMEVGELKLTSEEVVANTGPGLFTDTIFEYLSNVSGHKVTPMDLTRLDKPRQFKDVLVLPVNAFAPGQRHSGSKPVGSTMDQFAFHAFHGTHKAKGWARE